MAESASYSGEILSLPVETNMRPTPPTISPEEPTSTVMDLMASRNVGLVVVVGNNRPVGVVTERDMLQRALKPGKNLELMLVKDIMSKPPVTIEAERSIRDALEILHRHSIRRLIVTREGAVVGLTTAKRLLEIVYGHYIMKGTGLSETVGDSRFHRIRIAYVSTYPPRECGIATYTRHLVDAVSWFCARAVISPIVVAVNDRAERYEYGTRVKSQIDANNVQSYEEAARYINTSDVDVVNLQHEYGIFGGESGEYVAEFLQRIEKPVVTTLHTVVEEPTPNARAVLQRILEHSDLATVMAKVGIRMLEGLHRSSAGKIRYVPHGCPNIPFIGTAMMKESLGLKDRAVISTFGLLSRGKGIEYGIQALPQILEKHPEILYLVIGETHPQVRKHDGETYRRLLLDQVESLGVEKNVRFVNRFLTENELISYLQATDVYVIPYPNREQISSGTLSYALGAGKAIVTTSFVHAQEPISSGAAMQCEFKDPASIAECVDRLLNNDQLRQKYARTAYEYSRPMIWPNVAMRYVNAFYYALGL
jgi:CBS domain-containing protein/glycosyltransferase involved in cell wall biosynthesis